MRLLRAAQRCNQLLQSNSHGHGVCLFQRHIIRSLSTDSAAGSEQPAQGQSFPIDPFLQTSNSSGFVYGRLGGINRHTLKTDIINLLEDSHLTLDNVKVAYNRLFNPTSMLVQFPSMSDYDAAFKAISRRGRLFKLEKTDQSEWDITKPYNGKYVLLQGLATNTFPDDVHRFLDGCSYDSSSFEMFVRATFKDPIKMATVRFPSQIEAVNAAIRKNRGFLNNNQVIVRILQ